MRIARLPAEPRPGGGLFLHGGTMTGRRHALALALAAAAAAAAPRAARAGEKIAVLVIATSEKDAELADNLTEVIIAHAAQHGGFEIAGKEEFRARLGVENERRTQACLDDISCLGRAGVSLGVRRIVAGSVGTRGKQFLFNLNLDNVQERRSRAASSASSRGGSRTSSRRCRTRRPSCSARASSPARSEIASQPDGARVSIDNAYLGITPLISPTLLAGKHNVRVEADRRFPWTSRVEVLPGQELQIRLSPTTCPSASAGQRLRRLWRRGPGRRVVRDGRVPGRAVAAAAERRLTPDGHDGSRPEAAVRHGREHRFRRRRGFTARLALSTSSGTATTFSVVPSITKKRPRERRSAGQRAPPPLDAMGGSGYLFIEGFGWLLPDRNPTPDG